jgi:hypothetical protein
MSKRLVPSFLVCVLISGGAVLACSSSTSPSAKTPDLTGTWDLVSLDLGGGAIPNPPATGSFVFTTDSVTVDLNVPSPPAPAAVAITGTGSYTLTATKISINSTDPLLGQAVGNYTFVDKVSPTPDTLTAALLSNGITITAVVARP